MKLRWMWYGGSVWVLEYVVRSRTHSVQDGTGLGAAGVRRALGTVLNREAATYGKKE